MTLLTWLGKSLLPVAMITSGRVASATIAKQCNQHHTEQHDMPQNIVSIKQLYICQTD